MLMLIKKDFIGLLLVVNNGLTLCYGYVKTDYADITLPYTFLHYCTVIMTTEYRGYFAKTAGDPCACVNSNSSITCHTGSMGVGHIYWLTIGF